MATVTMINPVTKQEKEKIKVCAYCRVSSDSDDQENSYFTQIDYYTNYINTKPDLELVEIFADEGITGTRADKRKEFQRMLSLCRKHKIDLILTKSISRFARNVRDCLNYARELKLLNIGIIFEKEGINTSEMTSELMLAIFGSLAESESLSISKNLRMMNYKRMETGSYVAGSAPFGYQLIDKQLCIYETQAKIVRRIFTEYLSGWSVNEIARDLTEEGIPKKDGKRTWNYISVHYILTNEKYTGNTMFQKTYKTDVLPFEKRINKGEKERFYATYTHDAIIDQSMFDAVQAALKAKAGRFGKTSTNGKYPLSQKMHCSECGAFFIRRISRSKAVWVCRNHFISKDNCPSHRYEETCIYDAFIHMFNKLKHNSRIILHPMLNQIDTAILQKRKSSESIRNMNDEISSLMKKNHMLEQLREKGYLADDLYLSQSRGINKRIGQLKLQRSDMYETKLETARDELELLVDTIDRNPITNCFDEELFKSMVTSIEIDIYNNITFKLAGGLEICEKLERRL